MGEHCVLATNFEDNGGSISDSNYTLLLCNALGTPIDSKQVCSTSKVLRIYFLTTSLVLTDNVMIGFFQINIEPLYLSVTSSHVIVASRDAFYIWHFRTAQSWTTLRLDSSNKTANSQNTNTKSSERLYHVDDTPGGMYEVPNKRP